MSDFETEEVLELARQKMSGLLINLHPMPKHADEIAAVTQDVRHLLDNYVELKIGDLTEGILASVQESVQKILRETRASWDTGNVADRSESADAEDFYARIDHLKDLTDELVLEEFAMRLVRGAYSAEQINRFACLFTNPELFRSEVE
jgi:hypothetical protein